MTHICMLHIFLISSSFSGLEKHCILTNCVLFKDQTSLQRRLQRSIALPRSCVSPHGVSLRSWGASNTKISRQPGILFGFRDAWEQTRIRNA